MIRQHEIAIRSYLGEIEDENGNPVNAYSDIIKIVSSLNSVSGSYDAVVYGERVKHMVQTFVDYDSFINLFNEGSLVYLYGADYEKESHIGKNANYRIVSVLPQNKKIKIVMEKLP